MDRPKAYRLTHNDRRLHTSLMSRRDIERLERIPLDVQRRAVELRASVEAGQMDDIIWLQRFID